MKPTKPKTDELPEFIPSDSFNLLLEAKQKDAYELGVQYGLLEGRKQEQERLKNSIPTIIDHWRWDIEEDVQIGMDMEVFRDRCDDLIKEIKEILKGNNPQTAVRLQKSSGATQGANAPSGDKGKENLK